jgi:hypothetical protein
MTNSWQRLSSSYPADNTPDVVWPERAYWAAIFAAGDVRYVGDPAAAGRNPARR